MVDVRYVILFVILIGATVLIYKYPRWAVAVGIGLTAAGLAYAVMFGFGP